MNIVQELYQKRDGLFLRFPSSISLLSIILAIVGIATLGYGLFMPELQVRTWASLLLATFFFFSLAMGGIAFGMMQDVVGALWGRPIKRIHDAFGAFLLPALIIFTLMFVCIYLRLLGAGELYSWIANPDIIHHYWGKNIWLNETAMIWRDFLSLLIINLVAYWYYKQTLVRDHKLLKDGIASSQDAAQLAQAKLRYWSGPLLFLLGVLYTLLSFDLIMSLAPTWFSTLWGGWSFSVLMQTLMATLLLFMFVISKSSIGAYIGRQQFHDVGKLMHGFTVFFAYLTYAHVLTYWFANMPETAQFYIDRLQQPWLTLIILAPIFNFLLPLYILIPKASKWTKAIAVPIASLILFAQFLTYVVVVIPNVVKADQWAMPMVIELGVFLGVFGFFLLVFAQFAKRNPMISIADPLLPKAYEHH